MSVWDTAGQKDATALVEAIRGGKLSCAAAMSASLAAIRERDHELKAFITVAPDAADRADALDFEGARDRPLFGLPLAVKDLIDTAGLRTTRGSLAYRDHVPEVDDVIVERAVQAGAIVVGKTNTPEFGFGAVCQNALCGPTANPLDPTHTSGGSSGGSAVAVATGMAAAALGTDYGGSVRMPAAFCGIVGFRPTPGRLPTRGRNLLSDGLNTTGIMTRSVRDARLLFDVLKGPDRSDPISLTAWPERRPAASPPRLAATLDFGCAPMSSVVTEGFDEALDLLSPAFAIHHAHPDCAGARESFGTLRGANIHHHLATMRGSLGAALAPTVRWNIERGQGISAAEYLAAEASRADLVRRFHDFFDAYDVLISPTAAVLPFRHEEGEVLSIDGQPLASLIDYFTVTLIISLVGCPAVSIPFWPGGAKWPIGLQVVAAPGADATALNIAEHLVDYFGVK